ncbi:cupin domain-containing protein [Fulvivirga sp.]|uniref:cupin domain-containing protein n=1 Tax=Fulvivirga sp. TaxID=1931237 RepID=UPI0032EC3837
MKLTFTLLLLNIFVCAKAQHETVAASVLLEQILNDNDLTNNMVRIETLTFPPGYSSVKHTHPCPLFVYIVEGELLSEFEGVMKTYKVGDVFYEKANGVHSVTKNNSSKNQAKILVIYLMKEGQETFLPFTLEK